MAKKNATISVMMNHFSVEDKSTLNDILRNVEKLKKFKAEKEELGLTKAAKKVKGGYFDQLNSALYIWYLQELENSVSFLLKYEKALSSKSPFFPFSAKVLIQI